MENKEYTLATGDSGAYRLQILNKIHQPYTEFLLKHVGLSQGMQVADIGCGTGNVSFLIASKVGVDSSVCGVDISEAQLDIARSQAQNFNFNNISFVEGSAYNTGLPKDSFDLVYCRFVLIHLNRPVEALLEMKSLLKPGGLLVCEEADFSQAFCEPSDKVHDRCYEMLIGLAASRDQNFCLGVELYKMFQQAGFINPEISFSQPVVAGENKRLIDMSLMEARNSLIEAGLTVSDEVDEIIARMKELAEDKTTLFGIPRISQIWGRK